MKQLMPLAVISCLLWSGAHVAHAKKIRNTRTLGQLPVTPVPGPSQSYINFTTVESQLDCKDFGGPTHWGNFPSTQGTIEIDSNMGIRLDFDNGPDLKTQLGTLPTTFHFAVWGAGKFDDKEFVSLVKYQSMPSKEANSQGTIFFDAAAPKGLKTTASVTRRGLMDHAGQYSTQIVLNWSHW